MKRRDNIKLIMAGSAGIFSQSTLLAKLPISETETEDRNLQYIFPIVRNQNHSPIPENVRIPFGWSAFPIGNIKNAAFLSIPEDQKINQPYSEILFRISVAVDVREALKIKLEIAEEEIKIGEIDIKYAPALQIHECKILSAYADKIKTHGINIYIENGSDSKIWLFEKSTNQYNRPLLFQPHFLVYKKKRVSKRYFFDQIFSENSLQQFGWMEGCVLDGLWQLEQHKTFTGVTDVIDSHLNRFFTKNELVYEDARSLIADNKLSTIEATLPFAILAIRQPDHPFLKKVEEFWKSKQLKNGLVIDGNMVSAEGNYTLAYPMTVMGALFNREDLIVMALKQLRLRQNRLIFENNFFLRYYTEEKRTFKNWARGVAWYLLGLVRTLHVLHEREDLDDLKEEFKRAALRAIEFQQRDGLWNCFMDDEDSKPDTAGSAGIAAAIAAGCSTGLLPYYLSIRAERTWEGLMDHLTPDGLLRGTAQSNKGGENLQRSDYRVISQMGMGLMAQLYAFL